MDTTYSYVKAVALDVLLTVYERYKGDEIVERMASEESRDKWHEELYDDLWNCDYVTGNASGSYTMSSYKAKGFVFADFDAVRDALHEFYVDPGEIGNHFLRQDWEWFDCVARCGALGRSIDLALDCIGVAVDITGKYLLADALSELASAA